MPATIRFDIGRPFFATTTARAARYGGRLSVFDDPFLRPATPRPGRASGPRRRRRVGQAQFRHAHQIARREDVLRGGMRARHAAVAALAEAAGGLAPAEEFFDALAYLLARGIRRGAEHAQCIRSSLA